jgi:hypothetical protein
MEDTSFYKKMEYEPNISKIFFMSWNMNFVKPNRTLMIAVIIPIEIEVTQYNKKRFF